MLYFSFYIFGGLRMNLEFLPDGSDDCPLLILSPSVYTETEQLYRVLCDIILCSGTMVDIHALPYISPVDDCQLTAQVAKQDFGVVMKETGNHFTWKLTHQTWIHVLDLLYIFTLKEVRKGSYWLQTPHGTELQFIERIAKNDGITGYQWLDETSDISVLISTYNRRW